MFRISPYSVRMRKIRTRITTNTDTFYPVCFTAIFFKVLILLKMFLLFLLESMRECPNASVYKGNLKTRKVWLFVIRDDYIVWYNQGYKCTLHCSTSFMKTESLKKRNTISTIISTFRVFYSCVIFRVSALCSNHSFYVFVVFLCIYLIQPWQKQNLQINFRCCPLYTSVKNSETWHISPNKKNIMDGVIKSS